MRTMAGHAADVTARRDAVSGRDAVSVTRDRCCMVWALMAKSTKCARKLLSRTAGELT